MSLAFWKWQGLGNDFMLLNSDTLVQPLNRDQIRSLADRHCGVGFDQLLLVSPSRVSFQVHNADASAAQQCGNGLRCVAAWLRQNGFVDSDRFELESPAGRHAVEVHADGSVSAAMGEPRLDAPFTLDWQGQSMMVQPVDLGNPHAVLRLESLQGLDLAALAAAVLAQGDFPQGVNVGALEVSHSGHARLQVFERGSGATQACGSGACAAMAASRQHGWLESQASIAQPGGVLSMHWPGPGRPLWMRGPAESVFRGEITAAAFV